MSIKSEITRLQNAKTAIATAIKNKGVSVPTGTKLDEMSSLINNISTGTSTSDATAIASDVLQGKTAYNATGKITGTIESYSGEHTDGAEEGTAGIFPSGTLNITSNATYDVITYASAVVNVPIPSGYIKPSGTLSVTSTGTYNVTNYASATFSVTTQTKSVTAGTSSTTVTPDSGKYLTSVTVNPTPTETKTVTPTASSQSVTPSSGKYLSKVTVNAIPSSYIIPSGTKTITENGTHDVKSYASVSVNVASSGSGGGSSSGGGVPTCTLTVSAVACDFFFRYSKYSPITGTAIVVSESLSSGHAIILDYVVCGSLIVFDTSCVLPQVTFSYDELPIEPPASDDEKGYWIGTSRINLLWCQAPMYPGEYSVTVEDWD